MVLNIGVSYLFKTPTKSLYYVTNSIIENFEAISQALHQLPLSSGLVNMHPRRISMQLENCEMILFLLQSTRKVLARNPNHPPWIKGDLAKAIRKEKTFWRKVKNCNNPVLLETFRENRQFIKIWIRSARKKYLADIANEVHHNSKRFGISSPSKIKYSMVRTSFPTTLHTPTPFLSTVSPSTKITLVVAILRRSLFLWIH